MAVLLPSWTPWVQNLNRVQQEHLTSAAPGRGPRWRWLRVQGLESLQEPRSHVGQYRLSAVTPQRGCTSRGWVPRASAREGRVAVPAATAQPPSPPSALPHLLLTQATQGEGN